MNSRVFVGVCGLILCIAALAEVSAWAQPPTGAAPADTDRQRLHDLQESLRFAEDSLARRVDEQMLIHRLEDVAEVDKVRHTGPPPRVIKNPTGQVPVMR